MATILLEAAGSALFGAFGSVGAVIGEAAGALAGAVIDRTLLSGTKTIKGHPLSGARISGADEGTGVSRVYGAMRVGGMLFWATRFEEAVTTERAGAKLSGPKVRTYSYFANFALGLCEGEIACIRRVWADGKEIDTTDIEMRVYRGSADQQPDPLIEAKQGGANTPAYRGLAYVVFERLPLDDYGNRIPVLQFEVVRPVGKLEKQLRAVTLIPGATEHGYTPTVVAETTGPGARRNMNRNVLFAATDWQASIDELQALCPNLRSVALVTSWFATDLRADNCTIRPGVEVNARTDESAPWTVDGIGRADAYRVSTSNGGPAYGGTPDDASIVAAIRDLRNRGLKVVLYPFVMMDIPADNAPGDPYGDGAQAAYPWRGRITCDPAPGQPATADRTEECRDQVDTFCGEAAAPDFSVSGADVAYTGGDFGYRRFLLHYAHLAVVAGGVDGFVIGSELRGLTRLRDATGAFPFVEQLTDLAAAAKSILGAETSVTYGADWSEYFGYHPDDGSGDVYFNLDPLWASEAVDAVGIDNYMPLADWRDGDLTTGNPDGFETQMDPAALSAMITAGEGFDWYYASTADRAVRQRAAISDGLANKPWVFRYKDIESWWSNLHHERVGGSEVATPTDWQPKMKPVWFTEIGCPAVDKAANQPNVFPDRKSSESAIPYFSSGARNDLAQRRFLEAHHAWWQGALAPGGMVDPDRIFVWTWDARPYPAFPYAGDLWSDGVNWRAGHWLNGRLGSADAPDIIAAILSDFGFSDFGVAAAIGDVGGYAQADPASARTMLEPILDALGIDVFETGASLRFQARAGRAAPAVVLEALADREDKPLISKTRAEESALASEAMIDHLDPANDYESATARSRRLVSGSNRQHRILLPATMDSAAATRAADLWLRENWSARRSLSLALSPAAFTLEPGDPIRLPDGDRYLVTRVEDGVVLDVTAEGFISAGCSAFAGGSGSLDSIQASAVFSPVVEFLDLPVLRGDDERAWAVGAAHASPWRPVALSVSAANDGYSERVVLGTPARIGVLAAPLPPGYPGRFGGGVIDVDLYFGAFASVGETAVLSGANVIAVVSATGVCEIIQFADAQEISDGRWRLSRLLRGQAGTDDAMAAGAPAGARVIALDTAVLPLGLQSGEIGLELNWIAEPVGISPDQTTPVTFIGGLRALTPLSPVHCAAARDANSNVVLTWIRRGRIDADSWLGSDIPLDQSEERYRLEIMGGATVLRSVEITTSTYTYLQTDELSDFGARQTTLAIRLHQIGDRVADGIPLTTTVPV